VHKFFVLISLKVEIKKVGDVIILETGTGDSSNPRSGDDDK
jgi:hypothetical protein